MQGVACSQAVGKLREGVALSQRVDFDLRVVQLRDGRSSKMPLAVILRMHLFTESRVRLRGIFPNQGRNTEI